MLVARKIDFELLIYMSKKEIIIFTDGASRGNPGPGGWGVVITDGQMIIELGGGQKKTTNNEMELWALFKALEHLGKSLKVLVYLDSRYVLNGVTAWIPNWHKNDWTTKNRKPVLHKELWQKIDALLEEHNPRFLHIPGHAGINGNEAADLIAQNFADGKKPKLFSGSVKNYKFDLGDLRPKHAGASQKKKRSGAKAYSYVSLVDGVVKIHKTWAECEKRVKGARGARFKKALSPSEETELVREYHR